MIASVQLQLQPTSNNTILSFLALPHLFWTSLPFEVDVHCIAKLRLMCTDRKSSCLHIIGSFGIFCTGNLQVKIIFTSLYSYRGQYVHAQNFNSL